MPESRAFSHLVKPYTDAAETTMVKGVFRPQCDCQEVCGEWLATMLHDPNTHNVIFIYIKKRGKKVCTV